MELLYLNGIKFELEKGQMTRVIRIADIGDISARKSSYSYTLKIARTSKNAVNFDMLGTIGNISRKPFEEVSARYIVKGITIIENGFGIIKSTSKNYEINVIDGVRSLSSLLVGKKISSLPLSDIDHVITTATYTSSYENTGGYIYGIADYGFDVNLNLKVEHQAPSIFIHTLIEKIFANNNINAIGDFFTQNTEYLNEVLTPSRGYLIENIDVTETHKGDSNINQVSGSETQTQHFSITENYTFVDISLVDIFVNTGGDLEFSNTGLYKIKINTTYNNASVFNFIQYLKINGVQKAVYVVAYESGSGVDYQEVTLNIVAGDILELSGIFEALENVIPNLYILDYEASLVVEIYELTGGQIIQASDFIGEVGQFDLIKDISNRYGLVLRPMQNGNFEFRQLDNILQDKENAEDWTDKLAEISNESYESGYAQINKATFKYENSIVTKGFDGEMLIDNFNTGRTKTIFSSLFEIPATARFLAGIITYKIHLWLEGTELENKETPVKVMKIKRVDTTINAKLFDEVVGIDVINNIPFLSLENISMQFFLDTHYSEFKKLIENYKEVDFLKNLSVIDIYNLDFFKLKYLKQTGRYYYLQSVQYSPEKLSKILMLEIN